MRSSRPRIVTGRGNPIVCASGLSPSGPVHLGNLREVLTPHLVADEIRRRGVACEHIISWDDYDRFRRVPATIDSSWSEHVGKPLTQVPAAAGQRARELGRPLPRAAARPRWRNSASSSAASRRRRCTPSGAYTGPGPARDARAAPHRRDPRRVPDQAASRPPRRQRLSADEAAMNALALEGSGAADEDDGASASRLLPVQAVLRGLRPRPDDDHRVRRRRRRSCPTPAPAGTRPRSSCASTPTASWSGRSTGRCAGPTRA